MLSKLKIAAAALGTAALVLAGAGAASAGTKPHVKANATAACGHNCLDIYSLALGHRQIFNAYIAGDTGVVPSHGGQKLNLHFADDTRPNSDFTGGIIGQVSQFCRSDDNPDGVLSSTSVACTHYASFPIFEADWSPWGNESGYCAGLRFAGVAGNVILVPCGASPSSLWVVDISNSHIGYTPLINASETSFSHPLVLTLDAGTHGPQDQLFARPENLLTGGYVANSQMWAAKPGPAV